MVGMAMAAAKLNPMVRILSTPGVYIVTHLGLNALFGVLNGSGVIKNDIGGKIVNVIHALISLLVMINLYKNPLIYGGSEEITKETGLFWLLIPHLVVNIIYGVLVCFISDEETNKIIKIIYSCVSSLVLFGIAIFGNPELLKKMKDKVAKTEAVAFGKRQRRRNPPKRRRRKKKY